MQSFFRISDIIISTEFCCKGAPIACDAREIATTTLVVRVVLKSDQIFAYNTI